MNVRFSSSVAALALVLAAAPAAAQMTSVERTIRFGVSTGASLPMGDFGDAVNTGWNLTGFVDFRPEAFPVTLRGELGYHRFGSDRISFGEFSAEQEVSFVPVVANAIYVIPSQGRARFHVLGGLGMYFGSIDVEGNIPGEGDIDASDSSTDFGFNLGGGVSFPLGQRIDVLVEGRFHSVMTEGESSNFIPITIGLRF